MQLGWVCPTYARGWWAAKHLAGVPGQVGMPLGRVWVLGVSVAADQASGGAGWPPEGTAHLQGDTSRLPGWVRLLQPAAGAE